MALVTVETLPTNMLEAVNLALRYMREPPIDDLALVNTSFPVEKAYRAVIQSTRSVQRRDYMFNCFRFSLTPELHATSGEYRIKAPTNATKVQSDPEAFSYDRSGPRPMLIGFNDNDGQGYVQFIVDARKGASTRHWDDRQTLDLLITLTLPFDALPEAAKAVVALEAAALCGEDAGEGIENSPFHTLALQEAQTDLMNYDLTVSPVNFYSTLDHRR